MEIVEREGAVLGVNVDNPCNQWELCCVVILCREGWRRSTSQITLGFLIYSFKLRHALCRRGRFAPRNAHPCMADKATLSSCISFIFSDVAL